MAEASSFVCKSKPQKDFTDSEMAAAAEQLMQLSGEDNGSSNNSSNKNKNKNKKMDRENDQNQSEVTSAKIQKEEESFRVKKRRYRSIDYIYMVSKPLNVIHGKKIKS